MGEKVNLSVELKPGRPRDAEVQYAVLAAIRDLRLATCEKVRLYVSQMLNRNVSWHTIKNCLEELYRARTIRKQVLRNVKRESSVYVV
jgi:hypothetical protein